MGRFWVKAGLVAPALMGVVLMGPLMGLVAPGVALAQEPSVEEKAEGDRSRQAPGLGGQAPDAADKPARDPSKGAVTGLSLPRFVSLKGDEGKARRGPGLTHRIDWLFTRAGMPLKITAEYEHWRRVEDADGAGGWVHYILLSGVRTALVVQDMAEAHAAPDPASEVLFQNELNVVGKLLECQPDWCRIQVEGEKGWLPKTALWGVTAQEVFP